MKTFAEIEPTIDATSKDVDNWIRRLELSTDFAGTVQGKARLYSRENTLELALIAALVKGGATPSRAASYARRFVQLASSYVSRRTVRNWLIFPGGDLQRAIGSNTPDLDAAAKEFGNPTTLCAVHIGDILRRVDELFEVEG